MPAILFPDANVCIYCGATKYAPKSPRGLAEEHIIPFGLNGNLILPKASCRQCEVITGRIESILLRGMLLASRTLLNLDTRKPKERPAQLPLYVPTYRGDKVKVLVDVADYPAMLMMMRLKPPPALTGEDPQKSVYDLWCRIFKIDTATLREKYGANQWSPPIIPIDIYRRALAKMAHAYAAARIGIGNFDPLLSDLITRDDGQNTLIRYVGGIPDIHGADDTCLHWVRHEMVEAAGDRFLAVRMRLFALIAESPEYLILVGRVRDGVIYPEPVTEKVLNTENVKIPPPFTEGEPYEIAVYGRV